MYPFAVFLALTALFIDLPWPENYTLTVLMIFLVPIFISFMILPGIIYEDGYKYAWHGFGKNQIHYNFFLGITLGFGPIYVFFKRYDPKLRNYFKS